MLKGLKHLANRALMQALVEPRRLRKYEAQSEAFVHKTSSGLTFELLPNQFVDRYIAVEGIFERRFLEYVRSLLPSGAVMLDIGANIGNHSLFLAGRCRGIHCFEPNPETAARLKRNIRHNGLDEKIKVHEFGLGKKDEQLTFHENVSGNLGASGFAQGRELPEGFRVRTLEVRHAGNAIGALGLDKIDYIKIDVEGMEESVLTSLRPILARYRPIVSFEHHEQQVSPGTFDRIRALFPGYRFVEPTFAPPTGKVMWNLRHDGGPVLKEVTVLESRTYENILAMPNAA
jgi:FkbM family methyltransferase